MLVVVVARSLLQRLLGERAWTLHHDPLLLHKIYPSRNREGPNIQNSKYKESLDLLCILSYYLFTSSLLILISPYNIKLHYHESGKPLATQSAKNSLETLPIRAYLDQTVVPLVLQALSALAQ